MKIKKATTTVSNRRQSTKPGGSALRSDGAAEIAQVELGNASAAADHWIRVWVPHIAAPQGSHRQGFGKSVRETNPRTEPYRHAVAEACLTTMDMEQLWVPLDGPLEVMLSFHMPPAPKSDPNRLFPHTPPDLDKLIRSTFDGITRSKLWVDDARVCRVTAEKIHAATLEQTGVGIRVRRMS